MRIASYRSLVREFFSKKTAATVPVGILTAGVWLDLLSRWEETLATMQRRRLPFLRDFFRESMAMLRFEPAHVSAPASLIHALQELLTMIDTILLEETHSRQTYHAA